MIVKDAVRGSLTATEVIRGRRSSISLQRGYLNLVCRVLLITIICYLVFTQMFLLTQVMGNEMFPAVKDGDLMISFRLQAEYVKDDVVVYTVDGVRKVGRIAARGTDVVTLDDSGTLLVNGTVQSGEILYPTYAKEGIAYPFVVPQGYVFILSDYRTQTRDSRDFGPIPLEDVKAKVITILRRQGL